MDFSGGYDFRYSTTSISRLPPCGPPPYTLRQGASSAGFVFLDARCPKATRQTAPRFVSSSRPRRRWLRFFAPPASPLPRAGHSTSAFRLPFKIKRLASIRPLSHPSLCCNAPRRGKQKAAAENWLWSSKKNSLRLCGARPEQTRETEPFDSLFENPLP